MAYTAIPTYVTNQLITAAHGNTYWKENISTLFPYTTAGDIAYASSASVLARLGIGSAGQVLRVNSGASAPEWVNGGMTLIEEKLLTSSAASFDFTSIPAVYRSLKIILHARSDKSSGVSNTNMIFNNDTGNNYDSRYIYNTYAGTIASQPAQATDKIFCGNISALNATAGMAGSIELTIPNYSGTTFRKNAIFYNFSIESEADDETSCVLGGGHWRNTAAINRITIMPLSSNFIAGSIASLYGII